MARLALWGFVLPFALAVFTVLAMFRAYWIPSGSMKPALLVGDYVLANRLAYGFPELFCIIGTCQGDMGLLGRDVTRGDVATFRHPISGQHYVKRIVGLAGDRLQMRAGRLFLNEELATGQTDGFFTETYNTDDGYIGCSNGAVSIGAVCEKQRAKETLPGGRSYAVLHFAQSNLDEIEIFTVPAGHVFVMGDNRDNSVDSRVAIEMAGIGFVPLERMVGRVDLIVMSLRGEKGRFWKWVE